VKADPWFALHPFLSGQDEAASGELREDIAALDVAYPITYYANSTDEAAAAPIPIASGDRVQADMTLHAVPALHLTIHTTGGNGEQQRFANMPRLRQTVFGDQDFSSFSPMRPGPPGSGLTEFAGVAPGHYFISQMDPPRVMEIDTTGSQEVDLSSGAPAFSVEMKVRMADGSVPPQPLDLILISDDSVRRRISAIAVNNSAARFESVPPGRWIVLAESTARSLAVVSIQSGADSTADSRIVVKDRRLSVTAVLAQGKTGIEGFAKRNGKGEPGVMIVLVPRDPGASLELFRRDQSDSDGSFRLLDAAPGQYKIVAVEDGWELDWARPEIISRYLPGGTPVTVTEDSGASMRLSAPVEVQAR